MGPVCGGYAQAGVEPRGKKAIWFSGKVLLPALSADRQAAGRSPIR